MRLNNLRVASCMAPNADGVCRSMVGYLQYKLGLPMQFVDDISWDERERQFDRGEIQLCWLCGLPYVWKADTPAPAIELVAAPVMAAARYGHQPVYFVRRGSDPSRRAACT